MDAAPGPFAPPPDYRFEPELQGNPRRDIPPELRHGRHATSQRRQVWGVAVAGAVCLAASFLPLIQHWGLFLLPLAWLHWIGLALLVFAGGAALFYAVRRGPFRYVEDGLPLVVRVLALELRPTAHYNGQATNFRYFAAVEYRDPDTGELRTLETSSNDLAGGQKDGLACTYRLGDYATAVYLPGDLARSLRLYGFLDLRPDLGLVKATPGAEAGGSVLGTVIAVLGMFGLFFVMGWNIYALGVFRPVEWSATLLIPAIGGAVVLGGAMLALVVWQQRKEERARAARNAAAAAAGQAVEVPASLGAVTSVMIGVVVFAGCLLLGGLTAGCLALTLNAWLDTSAPRQRLVLIDEMVQVTHSGVFRRYEIKYRFADEPQGRKREYASTPEEMARFKIRAGVAREREGFFGWRWVERIVPMEEVRAEG